MQTLEKKTNIEKYNEKKSYREPQLKEIGRVHNITKGSGVDFFQPDDNWTVLNPTQS